MNDGIPLRLLPRWKAWLTKAREAATISGMVEANCKQCGKPFFKYPSSLKKHCSSVCRKLAMSGDLNPSFKGGKVLDKNGYIRLRGKRRYEHQAVMETVLGRPLVKGEEVHHLNGIKTDNRPENLFVVDKKNHSRIHFTLFVKVQRLQRENELLRKQVEELQCQLKLNRWEKEK